MQTIPASVQKREQFLLNLVFFVFAGLLILFRVLTFIHVNLQVVDSDQPFMWAGAGDYARGLFYEPRFYGQNYNTFLEGLFAVPFIWLGLPVYTALPLATHLLFLAPVFFTAFYLFLHAKKPEAITVLAFFLCLPVEFDVLTGIPRGFVTGIFFSLFFVISVHCPDQLRYLALNTVFALIGFFVNPNSVMVSVPVLFYLFLHHFRNRSYYFVSLACLACAWPLHVLFNSFYEQHPEYVVYGYRFSLSASEWESAIRNLPNGFVHISPFRAGTPLLVALLLVATGVLLWRHNRKGFYAWGIFIAGILASTLTPKTGDGSNWPFYSYSRMYLAVPLMLMLFLSMIRMRKKVHYAVVIVAIAFSCWKIFTYKARVEDNLRDDKWLGVHLAPLPSVIDAIGFYRKKCEENGCRHLVISNVFWLSTYLAYGGPALYPDYPFTLETDAERRYWVRAAAQREIPGRFIFLSCQGDFDRRIVPAQFRLRRLDDYGLYLVENNRLSLEAFADTTLKVETCR